MKSRKLIWLIFLLLLFISSYSREVLFRSINALMKGEENFYAKTTELIFLSNWSILELSRLKYFLTIGFSFLFIGLTLYGLKFTFKEKLPFQISLGAYILVVFLAGILILLSLTFSSFTAMYPYLRDLVGAIHNPILFLFISISTYSLKLFEKE